MRPKGQTFWHIGGQLEWKTAYAEHVAVSQAGGLRLAADANGPLSLLSPDGSLGGLVLPKGMALDESLLLYLLVSEAPYLLRFEPETKTFQRLCGIGASGSNARQLNMANNIAIIGHDLYVADTGNKRVQVFALESLALRHVWGPWDKTGHSVSAEDEQTWLPLDVCSSKDHVYILDSRYGRVFQHTPGSNTPKQVLEKEGAAGRWSRIAVDNTERLYLLDASIPMLEVYDLNGELLESNDKAGELFGRFPPPAIRLDHKDRFCLPHGLVKDCNRNLKGINSQYGKPVVVDPGEGLCYERNGDRIEHVIEAELAGPRLYATHGVWISQALDSQIFNCQWHRLVMDIRDLASGTKISLHTYTENEKRSIDDIRNLTPDRWADGTPLIGAMQPSGDDQPLIDDQLVQSLQGRYLWLKIELDGDGYATSVLQTARIHYPRDSYLKYLPALFAADPDSNWFLQRFLSIFQSEWDAMESRVAQTAQYYDADAVPGGPHMNFLASWLDEPLQGHWDAEQNRHLIMAAQEVRPHRGTVRAIRGYLQAYLHNITGIPPQEQCYPILLEGFRERDYFMLSQQHHARLNSQHPMWSPQVVGRLQLERFSTEGKIRLVSTGDPDRDVFHEHAHRFTVFLPAAWVRTARDERLVRRAVEKERPAHTDYDLCLVEPRFQVGQQSMIGIDTILGDYPQAILAGCDEDLYPPSRAPSQRLGYDTVLGGKAQESGGTRIVPGLRVGINTLVS